MPEASRLRIFQPGRATSGRAVVRAPQEGGATHGHSAAAPGHGNAPPGHGGVPPGLVSAFTAIAVASSTGVVTPVRPDLYRAVVLADAPLAYWRLDETSGTTVHDSSVTGTFTGTYVNSPTLGEVGIVGAGGNTAVFFNNPTLTSGQQQYAHFGNVLPLNGTKLTIEFWLKIITARANAFTPYISRGTGAWRVNTGVLGSTQVQFGVGSGGTPTLTVTPSGITDGDWHHVVCVYDQAHLLIYYDGAQAGSTAWTTNVPLTTADLGINRNSDDTGPYGLFNMDEVAIYNTALSAARVLVHYNAGITA